MDLQLNNAKDPTPPWSPNQQLLPPCCPCVGLLGIYEKNEGFELNFVYFDILDCEFGRIEPEHSQIKWEVLVLCQR